MQNLTLAQSGFAQAASLGRAYLVLSGHTAICSQETQHHMANNPCKSRTTPGTFCLGRRDQIDAGAALCCMAGAAGCCKGLYPLCTFWIQPQRTDHPHGERKPRGLPMLSENIGVGVIEYLQLERTPRGHRAQLPAPHRTAWH